LFFKYRILTFDFRSVSVSSYLFMVILSQIIILYTDYIDVGL